MFSHKVAGKYISRIVCMVMFVLIQFDVFGYDLIYAAFCDDEPSAVLTVDDESSVSDSQGEYAVLCVLCRYIFLTITGFINGIIYLKVQFILQIANPISSLGLCLFSRDLCLVP